MSSYDCQWFHTITCVSNNRVLFVKQGKVSFSPGSLERSGFLLSRTKTDCCAWQWVCWCRNWDHGQSEGTIPPLTQRGTRAGPATVWVLWVPFPSSGWGAGLSVLNGPLRAQSLPHAPSALTQADSLTHSSHQPDPGSVISQNEDDSYFFWTPETWDKQNPGQICSEQTPCRKVWLCRMLLGNAATFTGTCTLAIVSQSLHLMKLGAE